MAPWRSAAGTWDRRTARLVVAEVDGARGLGECAPLPGLAPDPRAAPAWADHVAHLDATARARGVALAALLSADPAGRVPLCAVVDSPAAALAAVASGFRTLKVKLRGVVHRAACAAHDTARVAEIRAAVGPAIAIRVDANRSLAIEDVEGVCDALAALGVEFLEEPAPGVTRRDYTVPIALDESLVGDVALEGLGAVVIKPTVLGPTRTFALIERARAAGVDVVISHALEGPVGFAACAELALAVGGTRAHGLGPHPALQAWDLRVPTLRRAELIATPRLGTGLDVDAVLARARRMA